MTIRAADRERIVTKLELQTRNSGDRLAWFVHDGRRILFTKRSNKKGRDLPFQHSIRQQLKLNEVQLSQLIRCTLDRNGYLAILREKGLL